MLKGWAPAIGLRIGCHPPLFPPSMGGRGKNFLQSTNYLCFQCTETYNLQPKSHVKAQLTCGSLTEAPPSPQPDVTSSSSIHLSGLFIALIALSTGKFHNVDSKVCMWLWHLLLWFRELTSLLNLSVSHPQNRVVHVGRTTFLNCHFMTVVTERELKWFVYSYKANF